MPSWSTTSNKALRLEVARDLERLQALFFSPQIRSSPKAGKNPHTACFPTPTESVLFPMTPARNNKPTDGALRAAKQIEHRGFWEVSPERAPGRKAPVQQLDFRNLMHFHPSPVGKRSAVGAASA